MFHQGEWVTENIQWTSYLAFVQNCLKVCTSAQPLVRDVRILIKISNQWTIHPKIRQVEEQNPIQPSKVKKKKDESQQERLR